MTRVYYKEASGALVVYDITRFATFEGVTKWKQDLDSKVGLADGRPIPAVLLANKCDIEKVNATGSTLSMDDFCHNHGFVGWFETSAKENIGISDAIRELVNHIITIQKAGEYEIPVIEQVQDVKSLNKEQEKLKNVNKKKSCCS